MARQSSMFLISALIFGMALLAILGLQPQRAMFAGAATAPLQNCGDSDGGLTYDVSGTVAGSGSTTYAYADHCLDSYTLLEQYCAGTASHRVYYTCAHGCVNSKCNA